MGDLQKVLNGQIAEVVVCNISTDHKTHTCLNSCLNLESQQDDPLLDGITVNAHMHAHAADTLRTPKGTLCGPIILRWAPGDPPALFREVLIAGRHLTLDSDSQPDGIWPTIDWLPRRLL